jgi:hypothetical protein
MKLILCASVIVVSADHGEEFFNRSNIAAILITRRNALARF